MANDVLARLAVRIDANTKQFGVALNALNQQLNKFGATVNAQTASISNFEKRIAGIQRTLGTLGIAFGTREIIRFASEAAKLAGQFEGVNNAFQKLPNSQKVLADLKEATQGTVSELELMRRTVQATNFGISLEQLPRLLEFAAVRAQQTGESVDYLVNSIVTGIGRKSPLILDNLGISAARLKEEFGGAALEAQSIADVTAAVGRIASEELSKMGRMTENTAVTMQQVAAAWENFKVSVGDGIVGDIFNKLAKDALTILRAFGPASEQAKNWTETLARTIADPLARRSGGPPTAVLDDITERLKVLRKEAGAPITFNIEQISERFKFTEQEIAIFLQRMEEVNKQLSLSERVMNQVTESANSSFDGDLSAAAAAQVKVLSDELVTLEERLAKAAEQNQSAFSIEALKRQIAVRRESLAILNQYIAGLEKANADNDDSIGLVAALEAQIKAFGESIKEATSVEEIRRLQHELEGAKIRLDALLKPSIAPEPITIPIEFAEPDLSLQEFSERILAIQPKVVIPVELDIPADTEDTGLTAQLDAISERLAAFKEQVAATFQQGIGDVIAGFAEDLGNAASGVGNFGDNILEALAGFAKQFGSLLIATGVAKIAFDNIGLSGIGAVAAGMALIAAAQAVSNHLAGANKALAKAGGVGGGGGATRTPENFQTERAGMQIVLGGEFKIRNDDLVLALDKGNIKRQRLG
jgi:hypothetical protein